MTELIEIKNIDGVFSNSDQEDIPNNFATTLQNFKSTNGKLVKSFAFGDIFSLDCLDIIDTAYWVDTGHTWNDAQWWLDTGTAGMTKTITSDIVNIVTYFNSNAATGSGSGSGNGYVFFALYINADTGAVTWYYWTGLVWESITNLVKNTPSTYYHICGKNPIVQENEIIRFLAGGEKYAGTGSAIHQPEPAWLGWIDRNYFDELYEATTDYTKGFYLLDAVPERPDLSSSGLAATLTVTAGGTKDDTKYYYKFSYLYDGVNETLLSEEMSATFTTDTFFLFTFTFDTATFNKRITAMNVYRSATGNIGDAANSIDGSYEIIHTINLIRDPDDITGYSGTQAKSGLYHIYIPDLADAIPTGEAGYWIRLNASDDDWYKVYEPTSANQKLFQIIGKWHYDSGLGAMHQPVSHDTVDEDYNGVTATQFVYGVKPHEPYTHTHHDNDCTAYGGDLFAFLDSDSEFSNGILANSFIIITVSSTKNYRVISANDKRYVRYGTAVTDFNTGNYVWQLLTVQSGLYYFTESGTEKTCYFYEPFLTEGAAYSLLNEPAIAINSKFAIIHAGRLWQGNLILDPGASGVNEIHPDWLSYSELNQYDINPVSNVIKINDATGGEITGVATSFGSIIILKKNSVHKLKVVDPSDATTWILSESAFNRGNLASDGYIQVGHNVYFCSTDGIYELSANFEAATDDTPLIHNRISEQINDVYLALENISEKPYIKAGYDKNETEIIFRLKSTSIWAYNITKKSWREIDTAKTLDALGYDQNDDLMCFNEADDMIYSINAETGESVGCCVATKFFNISGYTGERYGLVRSVSIRYMSEVALIVRCYLNGSTSPSTEGAELAPAALTQAYWDTVAGWDLSGSTLNHNADGAGAITPLTAVSVIAGDVYKVVITLTACTVGSCTYTLGGTSGTASLSSATTYTHYLIATNTGDLTFTPSYAGARFTISSVSIYKIVGGSLAISATPATVKWGIKLRCHSFKIEVLDLTSSTSDSEVYNWKLEVD